MVTHATGSAGIVVGLGLVLVLGFYGLELGA